MKENIIAIKSYEFAKNIVVFYQHISKEKKEFVLSKQILRSGTSICAQIKEAEFAQSKADFIHKMSIALKEANETLYWLNLLKDTGYCDKIDANPLMTQSEEILKILASIVKSSKAKK